MNSTARWMNIHVRHLRTLVVSRSNNPTFSFSVRLGQPFTFPAPTCNFQAICSRFSSSSSSSSANNGDDSFHNNNNITVNKKERAAYRVLGMAVTSTYEEVKGTFLRAALKHHPDKTGTNSVDEFIRYRTAFETIRTRTVRSNKKRNDNNDNNDDDDDDDMVAEWNDEEMQTWFYEETGEFLSFQMDQDTVNEVIKAFTTLAPGGRDPGEWEMARQLTEREARRKAGDIDDEDDDDGPLLQLTGSMHSGTSIRRRQRRWR